MSYTPRRSLDPQPPRRNRVPLIAAGVAAAVAAAGIGVWAVNQAGGAATEPARAGGAATACPQPETILADPSTAPIVEAAATAWAAALGPDCAPLTVTVRSSAEVARQGLGSATGWVPEDVSWQERTTGDLASSRAEVIGWSPLVVVADQALADSLGDQPLAGPVLIDLVTSRRTHADFGHADWGKVKLVLPPPAESPIGALGFASLARQVGDGQEFPRSALEATPQQRLMPSVQWRTVASPPAADVPSQLAPNPADAPAALGVGPRVGVTTEAVALRAAAGLRAWPLDAGDSAATLGLVTATNTPTMSAFGEWLTAPEGRDALLTAGVRVGDHAPAAEQLQDLGLPTSGRPAPAQLDVSAWEQIGGAYAAFSHRTSNLVVLDVSGSMGERYPGTQVRKVDLITQAAGESWALWPPGTHTGLMTFNTDDDDEPVFTTVLPTQPNNTPEYLAALPQFSRSFQEIRTSGGTPLYEAIWRAHEQTQRDYVDDHTNTVVILTDGRNEDSTSTMTADEVIERIRSSDPEKKVSIGFVALGDSADYATLKRIADQTGNRVWHVQDPREVATVLPQIEAAFSN